MFYEKAAARAQHIVSLPANAGYFYYLSLLLITNNNNKSNNNL